MQETRELEKNQLEALRDDDFAVSEEEEETLEEEKDAKLNLGVCSISKRIYSLVWYYGRGNSQECSRFIR